METEKIAEIMAIVADNDMDKAKVELSKVPTTELSELYLAKNPKVGVFSNHDSDAIWTRAVARSFQYHWNGAVQRGLSKAEFYTETGCKTEKNRQGQVTCKVIDTLANACRRPFQTAIKTAEYDIETLTKSLETGMAFSDLDADADNIDDLRKEREAEVNIALSNLRASIKTNRERNPLKGFKRGKSGSTDPYKAADAMADMFF